MTLINLMLKKLSVMVVTKNKGKPMIEEIQEKHILSKKRIYNSQTKESVVDRKIINGNSPGLMDIAKYGWAVNMYDHLLAIRWHPNEILLGQEERKAYESMPKEVRKVYDITLCHLHSMDSMQINNIPDNINPYITAPECNMLLSEHASSEAIHARSYQKIIETVTDNPEIIYTEHLRNKFLDNKNTKICQFYEKLAKEPTMENMWRSFHANQILEAIYFYSSFLLMYVLGRRYGINGTVSGIRFIQRDEEAHTTVFHSLLNSTEKQNDFRVNDKLRELARRDYYEAVVLEVDHAKNLVNMIPSELGLGYTGDMVEKFIYNLANERLRKNELEPISENYYNPFPWFRDYSRIEDTLIKNFEVKEKNYSTGGFLDDLEVEDELD